VADKSKDEIYFQHTMEMERCLISASLVGPEYIDSVMELVTSEDFRDPVYAKLWDVLVNLKDAGKSIKPPIVLGQVKKQGFYDQFNQTQYVKLVADSASPLDIEYYAEEVARLSAHRKMVWAATLLINSEYEVDFDPRKGFAQFEAKTQAAFADQSDGIWLVDAAKKVIGKHKEAAISESSLSIPTGFRELDNIIGGYFPGHLLFVGARPYMGKTTLALNMAAKLSMQKKNALFFSLEMTDADLAERVLSFVTGTPYSQFNKGIISAEKADALMADTDAIKDWRLRIFQKPRQSVRSIRATAKLHKAVHGLDVIFVDNLQIMEPLDRRPPKHEQLKDITERLKELSKELECTVVLLGQLNADADGEEPDDTHLAGSKSIIADVDEMIYLHRATKTSRESLLKITKARKGIQGRVILDFDGAIQWFRDAPQSSVLD
jgi:replicative DNA helicase